MGNPAPETVGLFFAIPSFGSFFHPPRQLRSGDLGLVFSSARRSAQIQATVDRSAMNTADAMLGYRDGPLEYFGKLAARLDDIFNLIPARLAALSVVAGTPSAFHSRHGTSAALPLVWCSQTAESSIECSLRW